MDNKLLSKIVNIFFGAALIQGANILLYMVLARLMPTEAFATYRQLFLIQAIVSAMSFSAIPTALLYFCNESKSLRVKWNYIKSICILVLLLGLGIAVVIFFARDTIALAFSNLKLAESLKVFAFVPLATMFVSMLASVFIVIDKTAIQIKVAGFIAIVKVAPVIIVAFVYNNFQAILWSTVLTHIVVGLFAIWLISYLGKCYPFKSTVFRVFIPRLCLYSFPLLLASSASILGLKIDHLIVSSLLGTTVYALYTVGAFEIPIFSLIQSSISAVLIPQITRDIKNKDYKQAQTLWKTVSYKSALLSFPIAILFIVEAEYIVTLLFSEKYRAAAPIFALFSSLALLRVITFGLGLRAMGKTNVEFYCTLVYLVSSGIGAYFFTKHLGMQGAAIWVLANTVIYAILISLVTAIVSGYNLRLWQVYPFKLLLLACVITFAVWHIKVTNINEHLAFIISLTEIVAFWWLGVILLNEKHCKKNN
ncbi:oligosaccharide flippase family protein [Colwellia sp. MSW7]|uniref:Oligosaccharide flippase family protein n=1 Tax=Colwellia maritima TaxID=2912588 RepID=A0ABS9X4A8_9GAMM|nr:oligosaccharide flippase family protein [Colwellia maritima]MCI2285064.1 oligosaccharide flippase family protein [Colwellia maritima]